MDTPPDSRFVKQDVHLNVLDFEEYTPTFPTENKDNSKDAYRIETTGEYSRPREESPKFSFASYIGLQNKNQDQIDGSEMNNELNSGTVNHVSFASYITSTPNECIAFEEEETYLKDLSLQTPNAIEVHTGSPSTNGTYFRTSNREIKTDETEVYSEASEVENNHLYLVPHGHYSELEQLKGVQSQTVLLDHHTKENSEPEHVINKYVSSSSEINPEKYTDECWTPSPNSKGRQVSRRGRGGSRKRGRGSKRYGENSCPTAYSNSKVSSENTDQPISKSPLKSNYANSNENAGAAVSISTPTATLAPRSYGLGTKRFRGKHGVKDSLCKSGLYCRLHDVLAPPWMIIENCMSALNIPHFAAIQLMNYGDEIFEMEIKNQSLLVDQNNNVINEDDSSSKINNTVDEIPEIDEECITPNGLEQSMPSKNELDINEDSTCSC